MALKEIRHPRTLDVRSIVAAVTAIFPDQLLDRACQVLEDLGHVDHGRDHVKSTVTKQRRALDLGSIWFQIEGKVEVPGVLVVQPRYCLQPDVSRKMGRLYAVEV